MHQKFPALRPFNNKNTQKHSQRRHSEIHALVHAAQHHHTSDRAAAATADIYQTRALPELGRQRSAPVDSQQSASLEHFPLPAKVSTCRKTIKRNAHTRMKMMKMFICVHIFTRRYQTHSGPHTEKRHARHTHSTAPWRRDRLLTSHKLRKKRPI